MMWMQDQWDILYSGETQKRHHTAYYKDIMMQGQGSTNKMV